MGTQQNLLLIIVVFTVGLAVFVGLIAFNQRVVKSNRNACIEDMNKFATIALAWWRTPVSQGGGDKVQNLDESHIDKVGIYIGFNHNSATNKIQTGNGTYELSNGGEFSLKFNGLGTEKFDGSFIEVDLIVNTATGSINIEIINL